MDIDIVGPSKGRFLLAEATVARTSDLGVNDTTYFTRTHLGSLLHAGDSVMGYHLTGTNFNNPNFEALEQNSTYASTIPDVILVKKAYPRKKKNNKGRNWRLKRMAKDEGEMLPRKQDQERMERDYEMFLRDVEEDTEFRSGIALYRAQQAKREREKERMDGVEGESTAGTDAMEDGDEDGDEAPKIDITELLDELSLNGEDADDDV